MTESRIPPCPPWCARRGHQPETRPDGWVFVHRRPVGRVEPVEVSVCRWDDYEVSETTVDVGVPDVEVAGMPESLTPAEAGELACLLVRAADVLINGVAHRQVAG